MPNFKPILASPADMEKLRFPVLASPKIDGIRAITGLNPSESSIHTRSLKPVPNLHIQASMSHLPTHLDGEILTYTDGKMDDFNTVQSKVMSVQGEPWFTFHVFDSWHPSVIDKPFHERLGHAHERISPFRKAPLKLVEHFEAHTVESLMVLEETWVDLKGWEGVMIRDPNGPYKFGRSTTNEGSLLKMKRFEDSEATVVEAIQRMRNRNEATRNALGYQERSHKKENLEPDEAVGSLLVEWKGLTFEIGTGFSEDDRVHLWSRRTTLPGLSVTFKYQGVGSKGRPRFPVFIGFRYDL
jgi:DNA ligase 1